tara:strand:+ start:261 stop:575 length:315 start_codon:yes stop_codon:yes gene_type:complete
MKSKAWLLLSFFPILILQGCGGGSIALKASDGSKISFNKEDVSCKDFVPGVSIRCTANGVRTDLTEKRYPFSGVEICLVNGNLYNEKTFTCAAAREFGKLKNFQ